jgi:hypothetical protein
MDPGTGIEELIYDGSYNPLTLSYILTNLTTGQEYDFYLATVIFNGESSLSDALTSYACDAPSIPDPPYRVSSTETSITLGWYTPSDYGGCSLVGYKLFRDDGAGGTITNEVDTTDIEGNPNLNQYDIDFTGYSGYSFRFQLMALNSEGSSTSSIASFIVATVPDPPSTSPTQDLSASTSTELALVLAAFTTSMNGGTDIISYQM